MRTEIIKGIVSFVITLFIVILGGISSPLESYTNTTSLLFSNKELIMVILIWIVYILKNIKLSMMIYSAKKLTGPYLFFFTNNILINVMLMLMLLETNKISLLVAAFIICVEIIISSTLILAAGFTSGVVFNARNIRVKEFLALVTFVTLVIDGMPFALVSWPVSLILTFVYILFVINLAFNNIVLLSKNM